MENQILKFSLIKLHKNAGMISRMIEAKKNDEKTSTRNDKQYEKI